MTVPSSSEPVISPAPELLTPAAAASIGTTDSSRKKLVSVLNSARNRVANGRVTRRGGPPGPGSSGGMVMECYARLLADGYLTSQTGSATWVGDLSGRAAATVVPPPA